MDSMDDIIEVLHKCNTPPARENSGVIEVLQNIAFINIYSIAKLNVLKIQSFPLTLVFAGIHSPSLSPRAEWVPYQT